MSKARIAISVPKEVLVEARRAVRQKRASSVSAYFAEAAAEKAHDDELAKLVADMNKQYGRPSKEASQWARRVLGLSSSTRGR